ncbi:unnamed protein product [Acanthosepion pharaonis]|uniref:Aftiphilin clathrin-binding box domain-containing protein n=1 Tax=Acanthosepion pharaonis TaxID=158019 RepID=A0A812CNF3_ACAPH|nr:unnamed protein product [Sepia pharaonis]
MSHIIPMVSDSPPPLDDDTWNDDDDDDFGNFASVTDHNIKSPSSDRGLCLEDNVDFGVFKGFNQYNLDRGISVKEIPPSGSERPVLQTLKFFPEEETHLTNGKPPQEGLLSKDNDIEFEQISCDTKTLGYLSNLGSSRGRDSMTDSGHCSTDISPVPKSDESPDSGDKSSSSELEETFNGEISHKANGQLTSDHCEEEDEEEEVSVVKLGDKTGCDKDKTSNSINGSTEGLATDLPPDFSCVSDKEDESCAHISPTLSARMDQMSADNGSSPSPPSSPPPPDFPPPARPDTPDIAAEIGADHLAAPDGTTDPYMLVSSQQPNTTTDDSDDWADFSSAPSFSSASNDFNLSNNCQFSLNPSISSTTTTTKESSVSLAVTIGNLHSQTDFGDHSQESSSSDKGRQKNTLAETTAQVSHGSSLGFNADFSEWDSSNRENQSNDRKIEADFPSQDESLAESSTDYEDMGPDGCDLRSNDSLDESYSISDHVKTVELKYSTEENQESDDDDEFGDFGRFTATGTNLPSEDFVPKSENLTRFGGKTLPDGTDELGDFCEFPCSTVSATVDDDDDDDDDDDWDDFATPPQLPTPAAPTVPANSKQEFTPSWDGSASDFHTHSTVSFVGGSASDSTKNNDDWANFATAVPPTPVECAGASSPFVSYTAPSTSSHKSTHSKVSNAIAPVLNKCFPETMSMFASTESSQFGLLKDLILDEIPLRKSHRSQKLKARGTRSSCCVWKQLLDVDVTDALTYHFTDSKGSNMLFRTLRIDSRKILMGHKKPGVPIFAANLGMLEPSKVTGNDASKSTNLTGSTLSQDTLIDTHRTEPRETLGQLPANPVDMKRMTAAATASANTLDLDFLVVKDSPETSISKSGVFESELLGGPLKPLPSFKPMQPLEDMLANTKSTTMKQCQPDEHLTTEASKVIQTLPDLSFMHAKVLMFPVRQSSQ